MADGDGKELSVDVKLNLNTASADAAMNAFMAKVKAGAGAGSVADPFKNVVAGAKAAENEVARMAMQLKKPMMIDIDTSKIKGSFAEIRSQYQALFKDIAAQGNQVSLGAALTALRQQSNSFRQQYGPGIGGFVNAGGQALLNNIPIPAGLAGTMTALAPGVGLAVDSAKEFAHYMGEAYDRTKELQGNIGRIQRIMGGSAQDAGRLYSSLRLIGQEDNVFATITFNQIQASLARLNKIRAGTIEANSKDEQFQAGLTDIGLKPSGITTFNEFAVQLSTQLQGMQPLARSEAVQNIGGLFGQDLANLVGFSPDVLKQVLQQQVEINQADLKMNEQRQLAYTKADTALGNFEAALTRSIGPVDTFVTNVKTNLLEGATGLLKVAQGQVVTGGQRDNAQDLWQMLSAMIGGFGMPSKESTRAALRLYDDQELAGYTEVMKEAARQFGGVQKDAYEMALAVKAERRLPGLEAAYDVRDKNFLPAPAPAMPLYQTKEGLEAGLKEMGDLAKKYEESTKKIDQLKNSLIDLNKTYYSQADAGFKQTFQGADRVNEQIKDYTKIKNDLAKTPEFYRVTKTVYSDGSVAYGSGGGVSAPKTKPLTPTQQIAANKKFADLQTDLQFAASTLQREYEDIQQAQAKVGKPKSTTTQADVDLQRQQYQKKVNAINAQAQLYQVQTGQAYSGLPGGVGGPSGREGEIGGGMSVPAAPVAVSTSSYLVRNKKFDQLTEKEREFVKTFNGESLDLGQNLLSEFTQFQIAAGKGNTQMFLKMRDDGLNAIADIASGTDKVNLGFLEQTAEQNIRLKMFREEISPAQAIEQTTAVRQQFLNMGPLANNPKVKASDLVTAGIITPEQAAGASFNAKTFRRSKEFGLQTADILAGLNETSTINPMNAMGATGYADGLYSQVGKPTKKEIAGANKNRLTGAQDIAFAQAQANAAQNAEIAAAIEAAGRKDYTGIMQLISNKALGTGPQGSIEGQQPVKRAMQIQYEIEAIVTGKDGKELDINKQLGGELDKLSGIEAEWSKKKFRVGITAELSEMNLDAIKTALDKANADIDGQLTTINKTIDVVVKAVVHAPNAIYVQGPKVIVGQPSYSGGGGGYDGGGAYGSGIGQPGYGVSAPAPAPATRAPASTAPKPRFYAIGGGIEKDRPAIVGENGPELIIPKSDGQVFTAAETRKLLALYADFSRSMKGSAFPESLASSPYAGLPDDAGRAVNALGFQFGAYKRKAMLAIRDYKTTGNAEELARLRQMAQQSVLNPTDLQARQQSVRQAMSHNMPLGIQMAQVAKEEAAAGQLRQAPANPQALSPLDLLLKVFKIQRPAILDQIIKKPAPAPKYIPGGGGRGFMRAMAGGGHMDRGGLVLVGEEGPELVVPETDGTVVPAGETARILTGFLSGATTPIDDWVYEGMLGVGAAALGSVGDALGNSAATLGALLGDAAANPKPKTPALADLAPLIDPATGMPMSAPDPYEILRRMKEAGAAPEEILAQLGLTSSPYARQALEEIQEYLANGSFSSVARLRSIMATSSSVPMDMGGYSGGGGFGGGGGGGGGFGGGGMGSSAPFIPPVDGAPPPIDMSMIDEDIGGTESGAVLDAIAMMQAVAAGDGSTAAMAAAQKLGITPKAAGGPFARGQKLLVGEKGPELMMRGDPRKLLGRISGGYDLASGNTGYLAPLRPESYSYNSQPTIVNVDARGAQSPVTTVTAVKRTAEQLFMSNALEGRRQSRRAGRFDK